QGLVISHYEGLGHHAAFYVGRISDHPTLPKQTVTSRPAAPAASGLDVELVHQLPDLLALALLLRHQLVVALLGHVLAYGALNEPAHKAAGAGVVALGRPRGQVPLIDLFFGDGKPLEPEGQALGCSVCEHATRRRWSRDPEVQN